MTIENQIMLKIDTFPPDEETNFKINKFFRTITKDKKNWKLINVKGNKHKIENFL